MTNYQKTQLEMLSLQRLAESTNTAIWVTKQKEGNKMAHTLKFSTTISGEKRCTVLDGHTTVECAVVYSDNLTIIVERIFTPERRIYNVREWVRTDECRATRLE